MLVEEEIDVVENNSFDGTRGLTQPALEWLGKLPYVGDENRTLPNTPGMLISADSDDDGTLYHKVREKFHRVPDGGSYCLADHDCQSISQGGGASLPFAPVHAALVLLSASTPLAHPLVIVIVAGITTSTQLITEYS